MSHDRLLHPPSLFPLPYLVLLDSLEVTIDLRQPDITGVHRSDLETRHRIDLADRDPTTTHHREARRKFVEVL